MDYAAPIGGKRRGIRRWRRAIPALLGLPVIAWLLADGRTAEAVRIVAAPESVAAIVSKIVPNLQDGPLLTPLATPQRAAFDLEAFGTVSLFSCAWAKTARS